MSRSPWLCTPVRWLRLATLSVSVSLATAALAAPFKILSGSFGVFPIARIEFSYENQDARLGFTGVVGVKARCLELPPGDEPAEFFDVTLADAKLIDVDRRRGNELVVLYTALKIGPQNDAFYGARVYQWNGSSIARLQDVELRLAGSKTFRTVVKRLEPRTVR